VAELTLSRRRAPRKVSLTPLVDLVFILLIFFMLQTNFLRPRAVNLTLPGEAGGASTGAAALYIEVQAGGAVWLDGERVPPGLLGSRLQARPRSRGREVVIAVDQGVALQRVVDIVDLVHANGLGAIAIKRARRFD
jgi:biopolymer transport protein ExbD